MRYRRRLGIRNQYLYSSTTFTDTAPASYIYLSSGLTHNGDFYYTGEYWSFDIIHYREEEGNI